MSKKDFIYQPISCRFGRFGITSGEYVNRTLIKCLSPDIQDDSDVGYEEVTVEIALNGVNYVSNDEVVFTFVGPNAGKMLWVYVLITIFTALVMIGIAALVSSYWNKIYQQGDEGRGIYAGDVPHIVNKQPRYLDPLMRAEMMGQNAQNAPPEGSRNVMVGNEDNRRNLGGSMV